MTWLVIIVAVAFIAYFSREDQAEAMPPKNSIVSILASGAAT